MKRSVNEQTSLTSVSKKINAIAWLKLYAIVLSANAEKKAFTAPILSSPSANIYSILPDTSKTTTMASFGGLFNTGRAIFRIALFN